MLITGMLLQCGEYVLIFIYTKTFINIDQNDLLW